jgi:hypothetical protein
MIARLESFHIIFSGNVLCTLGFIVTIAIRYGSGEE